MTDDDAEDLSHWTIQLGISMESYFEDGLVTCSQYAVTYHTNVRQLALHDSHLVIVLGCHDGHDSGT